MSGLQPKGFRLEQVAQLFYDGGNQTKTTTALSANKDILAKWKITNVDPLNAGSRLQITMWIGLMAMESIINAGASSVQLQFENSDDNQVSWSDFSLDPSSSGQDPNFTSSNDSSGQFSRSIDSNINEMFFRISINITAGATLGQYRRVFLNTLFVLPRNAILTRLS